MILWVDKMSSSNLTWTHWLWSADSLANWPHSDVWSLSWDVWTLSPAGLLHLMVKMYQESDQNLQGLLKNRQ